MEYLVESILYHLDNATPCFDFDDMSVSYKAPHARASSSLSVKPTIVYVLLTAFGIYSSCEIPSVEINTIINPLIEMRVLL